jgi:hypothetical protein
MKKITKRKSRKNQDLASEYRFDYSKAKPNRFAEKMKPAAKKSFPKKKK